MIGLRAGVAILSLMRCVGWKGTVWVKDGALTRTKCNLYHVLIISIHDVTSYASCSFVYSVHLYISQLFSAFAQLFSRSLRKCSPIVIRLQFSLLGQLRPASHSSLIKSSIKILSNRLQLASSMCIPTRTRISMTLLNM